MKQSKTILIFLMGLLILTACGGQTEQPAVRAVEQTDSTEQLIEESAAESDSAPAPVIVVEETTPTTESEAVVVAEAISTAVYSHDGCPDEHFLAIEADPNNSAYAAPSLTVTCDGNTMTIQSNNIPSYEFIALTPGDLAEQDISITIPINPQLSDTTTDIPLLGTTAVTVSGLTIYGPNEGANLGFGDPYLDEILDFCNGHTGPGGTYHLHAPPTCLFDEYDGQVGLVVGYALDGFPILAPYLCTDANCSSVYEVESSWDLTNPEATAAWEMHSYVEGKSELDECNGLEFNDGSYAYFATASFPYFMSCYRGEVEIGNGGNGGGNGQGPQQEGNGQRQGGGQQQGNQGRPNIDFAAAATTLGVTEEALRDALGNPPPDFAAAAAALGVTEQALQEALGIP